MDYWDTIEGLLRLYQKLFKHYLENIHWLFDYWEVIVDYWEVIVDYWETIEKPPSYKANF